MSFAINKNKSQIRKSSSWTENILIAHAGGAIEGKVYTNSLEAFEESYKNGHRLFEMDLSFTSDNKLIARHGWNDLYGQEFSNNELPTYEEFMASLYYGKYTPIDFGAILDLMRKYEDIHLILDGKVSSVEDTKLLYGEVEKELEKADQSMAKRLIPQMFYEKDIEVLHNLGFQDVIYVVGREEYSPVSIARFCMEHDIRAVSLSGSRTTEEFVQELTNHQIYVYMYTYNDIEKMKPYLQMGVNGFFTDLVRPSDLKEDK